MYSRIKTCTLEGLEGHIVQVECDLSRGLPKINIVGLPDAAIKESSERARAAIKNSQLDFPLKRITINLSPASLKKDGTQMDLAICIAILAANGEVAEDKIEDYIYIGEVNLDGQVTAIEGALPMIISLREKDYRKVIVPYKNRKECAAISDMEIYPVNSLVEVVEFINGEREIKPQAAEIFQESSKRYDVDFSEIRGQHLLKRAMEIAAAGGHNLLMIGSPGCGKSMAAKRLSTILPPLTFEESIEVTKIYSVAGLLKDENLIKERPFRSPHHTSSSVSLIGGGRIPKPGEVSLAHNGVLYLDELAEFSRNVLEVLRQPMEDHSIHIARAQASLTYPANFMFVGSMNPCPCGYYGHPTEPCQCSTQSIQRYLGKISHPLLDRIDIHVELSPVKFKDISADIKEETSEEIRKRVIGARNRQIERFKESNYFCNANIKDREIKKYCKIDRDSEKIIEMAFKKYHFSARSYHKILKVARTIADLSGSENIKQDHLLEAIRYRSVESKYWGSR